MELGEAMVFQSKEHNVLSVPGWWVGWLVGMWVGWWVDLWVSGLVDEPVGRLPCLCRRMALFTLAVLPW